MTIWIMTKDTFLETTEEQKKIEFEDVTLTLRKGEDKVQNQHNLTHKTKLK